jgi:hypothetical protein
MERKGDLLNQLAIISDLIEKLSVQTVSSTVVLELSDEEFNYSFDFIQKKYGRKMDKPGGSFSITIGFVDLVFNKSSV